jgi:hypothetical protein
MSASWGRAFSWGGQWNNLYVIGGATVAVLLLMRRLSRKGQVCTCRVHDDKLAESWSG